MKKEKQLKSAINSSLRINIATKTRERKYVYGRYIYFYYLKKFTTMSLSSIGRSCGRLDHATVLQGIRKFEMFVKDGEFMLVHDACVDKINELNIFPLIERLSKETVKPKKKYVYPKSKVSAVIRSAFLSNGITNDIMEMTEEEINEMVTYKIKPHILMLRSTKKQTV